MDHPLSLRRNALVTPCTNLEAAPRSGLADIAIKTAGLDRISLSGRRRGRAVSPGPTEGAGRLPRGPAATPGLRGEARSGGPPARGLPLGGPPAPALSAQAPHSYA